MSNPYLGEIRAFGFNFAPRGWALCNGQLLPIAQSTALFSILGTTYGGDGRTTFGLPDMQGRTPVHAGQGNGLTNRNEGDTGGEVSVVLVTNEIPQHNHQLQSAQGANLAQQTGTPSATAYLGNSLPGPAYNAASPTLDATFSPKAIAVAGGGQGHNNLQPLLTVNFCVCLSGVFPSRN